MSCNTKLTSDNMETVISEFFNKPFGAFDDLFCDLISSFPGYNKTVDFKKQSFPKVNIKEYNNKIVLEADIGTLTKDDVNVEVNGDVLILSGNKKLKNTSSEKTTDFKWITHEISNTSFRRSFTINETLDKNNISAEYTDGLLIINIPKLNETDNQKNIKINIK